jgi:hypothetical protein
MLLARVRGQPFDALVGQGRGRGERVYALGLLLILVALIPLAHASPPDPLWIAGIYDGADFDEAVVAVLSATGLVGTPVVLARPPNIVAGMVRPHVTVLSAEARPSTFSIRAPPV